MTRTLPPFTALKAFEAAARHRSFKAAADELNVTDSAISHQVKSLEVYLGVTLFHRETRGVSLTRAGALYARRLTGLLDELCMATRVAMGEKKRGALHVRSTPAFAARWLAPRLGNFSAKHPDIDLHISSSLKPADFTTDGIDVDVRFGHVESDQLHAEPVIESGRFPVASPSLFEDRPPLRRPGDLLDYVLLRDEVGDGWNQWFEAAGSAVILPRSGPHFAHCNLTLAAALEGQGVALAYSVIAAGDIATGALVRLFDVTLPATVIYSFVCPKDTLDWPKITAFRDWLVEAAAKPEPRFTNQARRITGTG